MSDAKFKYDDVHCHVCIVRFDVLTTSPRFALSTPLQAQRAGAVMHTRTGEPLRTTLGAIWNVLGLARELSCDRVVHLALLLALFEVAQVNGGKHGASIAELAGRTGTTLEVARHGVRSLRMHGLVTITERAARTEFFAISADTYERMTSCLENLASAPDTQDDTSYGGASSNGQTKRRFRA